jgi:hypothetical protein
MWKNVHKTLDLVIGVVYYLNYLKCDQILADWASTGLFFLMHNSENLDFCGIG